MTNSSSVFRTIAAAVAVLASLGVGVTAFLSGASVVLVGVGVVAAVAGIGFLALASLRPARSSGAVSRALRVCKEVSGGNFEARITEIREAGEMGELFWAINDVIDRAVAYLR
jgi:hypothetical protein